MFLFLFFLVIPLLEIYVFIKVGAVIAHIAGLAAMAVAPALPDFLAAYPQVDLEILSRDGVPDFVGDQIDAAVLIGVGPEIDIVARPLGRVPVMTVASPLYLGSRGTPASPEELARHQCIAIISSVSRPERMRSALTAFERMPSAPWSSAYCRDRNRVAALGKP